MKEEPRRDPSTPKFIFWIGSIGFTVFAIAAYFLVSFRCAASILFFGVMLTMYIVSVEVKASQREDHKQ